MANYGQVSYGSKGSDVTELQKLLNNNGYSLDVDGSFGSKTQAAVKDYQQKNGLSVDGIVGKNTWGALTKANTASGGSSSTAATETGPKYDPYQKSDTILQAESLLQQHQANKPGAYQSTWQDQLNQIISQIQNREKFSYDLNGDALYQQYKDQYTTQGKLAMMDTMGQAAAMNGGYGSSYAQSVGQQAYQGYLQQLNERVPELYNLALNQYNQEEQRLYDQASLIAGMEDQAYGRHRDSVSDYYTELNRLTEDARYKAEDEYTKWMDNTNFQYQQDRDKVSDEQWQATFDEGVRQYNEQMELQKKNSVSSGGGVGTDEKSSGDEYPTPSTQAIKNMQISLGVEADGKWGPESRAAAGGLDVGEAYKLFNEGKLGYSHTLNTYAPGSYKDAVAYIKANGGDASGLIDAAKWTRQKNNGENVAEVTDYPTYYDYLTAYVEWALS